MYVPNVERTSGPKCVFLSRAPTQTILYVVIGKYKGQLVSTAGNRRSSAERLSKGSSQRKL